MLFELKMNSWNMPNSKAKTTKFPQNPEKNTFPNTNYKPALKIMHYKETYIHIIYSH